MSHVENLIELRTYLILIKKCDAKNQLVIKNGLFNQLPLPISVSVHFVTL